MFVIEKEMPNGAICRWHKAMKFEVHQDSTHAVVNSYPRETMDMIGWQDTYVIPLVLKVESLADVETILTLPSAPFDGAAIVPAEAEPLELQKAKVRAKVKLHRNKAEWAGVQTPFGLIDSDPESQRKLSGAVQMALIAGETFTVPWRMADNSVVMYGQQEIIAAGMLVGQHVAECQIWKNGLDDLIEAATTAEELEAIVVDSGWPGEPEPAPEPAPATEPDPNAP